MCSPSNVAESIELIKLSGIAEMLNDSADG